jgi:hypothetical protein
MPLDLDDMRRELADLNLRFAVLAARPIGSIPPSVEQEREARVRMAIDLAEGDAIERLGLFFRSRRVVPLESSWVAALDRFRPVQMPDPNRWIWQAADARARGRLRRPCCYSEILHPSLTTR